MLKEAFYISARMVNLSGRDLIRRLNPNCCKSESLRKRDNPDGHPERDGGSSVIAAERWGRGRFDIRSSGRSRGMKNIGLST